MNSYQKWLERQEDAELEKKRINNTQENKYINPKRTKNVLIIILDDVYRTGK